MLQTVNKKEGFVILISSTGKWERTPNLPFSNAGKDIEAKEIMLSRRQARRLALQVLFSNEFLNENVTEVTNRVAEMLGQEVNDFCRQLVKKSYEHREELDQLILDNLRDWDIERIALLDRLLIRLALSELLYFEDIPVEVTINEALELSKEFISNKSCRFINGILDAILKKLQGEDRIEKNLAASLPPHRKSRSDSTKGVNQ